VTTPAAVITATAVLTSVADTVEGYAAALRAGASGVRAVRLPAAAGVRVAAPLREPVITVPGDDADRVLGATATAPTRAVARVAREAVTAARLTPGALSRTAVIVGGNNLALGYQAAVTRRAEAGGRVPPSHALAHLDIDTVGAVSELTGATAEGYTIGGSSASGALALIQACRLLALDAADHCLVAGALSELSTAEYRALTDSGAMAAGDGLAPGSVCRPFDEHRNGFVHGHGAAAVVLERPGTAAARGARPLAVLAGYAQRLDGKRGTRPHPDNQAATIRAALAAAGIGPRDVDYVNAHATGSRVGDAAEAEALARVFCPAGAGPLVNATKELTGHCLAASGVLEVVASALQLRDGFCHPNPNLREPADTRLCYAGPKGVDTTLRAALSTSFAFSGISAAIVITRGNPEQPGACR
jgi:malonyl-ACP decarboxylase